jgi:hypothetical protein
VNQLVNSTFLVPNAFAQQPPDVIPIGLTEIGGLGRDTIELCVLPSFAVWIFCNGSQSNDLLQCTISDGLGYYIRSDRM